MGIVPTNADAFIVTLTNSEVVTWQRFSWIAVGICLRHTLANASLIVVLSQFGILTVL